MDSPLRPLPTDTAADADLAALHAHAAAEAERFHGPAAPPAWVPERGGWSGGRRRLYAVAGALTLVLGAGGLWLAGDDPPGPAPSPAPISTAVPARAAPPRPAIGENMAVMPAPALRVVYDGGLWRVEADHASRLVAAQQLALLNGGALQGDLEALAASRPLTLHWQGTEAAFAWRAVLGDTVAYRLQCDHGHCQALVLHATPAADAGDDEPPGNQPPGERTEPTNPGVEFH